MKKVIKQEFREAGDEIYEFSHIEDRRIIQNELGEDEEQVMQTFRIMKTPYRNQEIEVSDSTRSIINSIRNKGN